jgi:hypothetical protein
MTITEIQQRVARIKACRDDPEVSYGLETELFMDLLRFIAGRGSTHSRLAREALKSLDGASAMRRDMPTPRRKCEGVVCDGICNSSLPCG